MYTFPTVSDFKAYFTRDFVYGVSNATVQDSDITKAFGEASYNFNSALFGSQANFTIAYMYLTAHFLLMDLRAASQGVGGQFSWLESSKAVGNVSQGFSIPQRILDNPEFSYLSKTYYGTKYLMLILPSLSGQIFTVAGGTQP